MRFVLALPVVAMFALAGPARADPEGGQPPAAAAPEPEPGEAPPPDAPVVTGVGIRAPKGIDPTEYEPLIAVRVGEPLSRREVRRSLQRLFELGRFANVSVHSRADGAGKVQVTFVLEPKRSVSRVELAGARRLDGERLRRAASLKEGDEFTEDRVDAAIAGIRAAYGRAGYEAVTVGVTTTLVEDGVELRFAVEEGQPTKVASLDVVGDPGLPALVRGTVRLGPGDVLDLDRLDQELDELRRAYREAAHFRARVGQPRIEPIPGSARAVVRIPVRAGPRIVFRFSGNMAFGADRLRQVLGYEGEELLDRAMVRELAARVERAYRLAGYHDARVGTSERRSPDRSLAALTFEVSEGRPLRVRRMVFDGNARLSDAELHLLAEETILAALSSQAILHGADRDEVDDLGVSGRSAGPPQPLRIVEPLQVFDDELYRKVTEALEGRYRDEGFLDIEVYPPVLAIEEDERSGTVTIEVREGPQTRVSLVEFPGATSIALRSNDPTLPVRAGAPLSERRVQEERLQLRALYGRGGWLYASVDAEVDRPAGDPTRAVVRFRVREGPQVRVGRVLVQGNVHTNEAVVRDTLLFQEGGVLGSEELAGSQQKLSRLGLFRTVTIRPIDADVPEPVKDIVVDVRERAVRAVEVGGGVSIADGPRSFAEFTERNIFGRNLEFSARGKVNYQAFREEVRDLPLDEGIERQVDLGLRYPRIYSLPVEVGARLDLIHERDIRPAYGLSKFSGIVGLDWPAGSHVQASLQYELEYNTITRSASFEDFFGALSRTDLERLRFPEGTTVVGSVRPLLALDLRDDPASPRRGFLGKAQLDYARDVGGDFTIDFVKVQATATGYVPIGSRSSVALSASGGKVFPLDKLSLTIPPKRFYLGGAGSLRGFTEDGVVPQDRRADLKQEIADCKALVFRAGCSQFAQFLEEGQDIPSEGGELFLLVKSELRFPLYRELMGGLFFEAGNLWLDQRTVDPAVLRPAAGFGLRYATPVGPVALDLGVNLRPEKLLNESPYALHFSIGLF